MRGNRPTIAMIGCGLIAERSHLPALAKHCGLLDKAVLVDPDESRTARLAQQFGVPRRASDVSAVIGDIDAAIVAVPPALHHPICLELLSRGVHVLCEKPLADTSVHAAEMIRHAAHHGATLCVNQTRRLYPAYATIRELLADGTLGTLNEVRYDEGFEFNWPAASGFHFRSGARGVLLDTGIHALDIICWWLGGKPTLVSSENDSFGGPEAMARLRLRLVDCRAELRLSWLGRLENRFSVIGDLGTISGRIDVWDRVNIDYRNGRRELIRLRGCETSYMQFGERVVHNFLDVIAGRAAPLVTATDVLPALELVDQAYRSANRLPLPWLQPQEEACYA
jgi:predicted dehydrogenase